MTALIHDLLIEASTFSNTPGTKIEFLYWDARIGDWKVGGCRIPETLSTQSIALLEREFLDFKKTL